MASDKKEKKDEEVEMESISLHKIDISTDIESN
jgi:hypothetical protein